MSWQRSLYSALMYALVPIFLLRLLWRSRANPAYRQRISERFALGDSYPKTVNTQRPTLLLHAVSVGETMAARSLIQRLLQDYPEHELWITSMTPTGSATVKQLFEGQVQHCYLPYDLPDAMRRLLKRIQPQCVLVMETELWPNLFHACQQANTPVMVINARLSQRSTRGYLKVRALIQSTLQCVQTIATRSEQDITHFQQLGATPQQCHNVGNIKFDLTIPTTLNAQAQQLRQQWGKTRPVWVAGSTHAGEDEPLLAIYTALKQQHPTLLLILVPRHPERFDTVAQQCQQTTWQVARRSQSSILSPDTDILLGDSMGELLLWYACADMAFIGGSLIERGGHNPLEAAAFDIAIISGEHVFNFADLYPLLAQQQAVVLASSPEQLQSQLDLWLQRPALRQQAGHAAGELFRQNSGVVNKLIQLIPLPVTETHKGETS